MGLDIYFDYDACEHCGLRPERPASVYVTYNHYPRFHDMEADGTIPTSDSGKMLGFIDGKRGADIVEPLRRAIAALSDEGRGERDGWDPTPGNARAGLERLLAAAEAHPTATISTWR